MILDNFLKLADGQTITTGATTSHVDLQQIGDSYEGCWVVWRIDATVTSTADTIEFGLMTSHDEVWTSGCVTLVSSTVAFSSCPADTIVAKYRIPPGTRRYISGFYKVSASAAALTSSTADCWITKDADCNTLITSYA